MRQAKNFVADYKVIHKVSREVRHRDAILLLPTHVRVRLVRPGFGRIAYMVPRSRAPSRNYGSASRRTSARPSRSSRRAATATTCSGPASAWPTSCGRIVSSCSRRGRASWTRPRLWTRRRRRRSWSTFPGD